MYWGLFMVISVLLILGILLEKGVNKLLGVKKKKVTEPRAKRVDRWGRGIILVIALLTLPFIVTKDINIMKWYWIVYFLLSLGFQSFLEWKYLKESKQYVTTLIFLILVLTFMYSIEYFVFWS